MTTDKAAEKNGSLYRKLLACIAEIDAVEKQGRNVSQNYTYQRSADVARAVRKALVANKLWPDVTMHTRKDYEFESVSADGRPRIWRGVDITCAISFLDTETGEKSDASQAFGTAFDIGDKAAAKAQTMALKYALKNAFLIPDESDPEADESVDEAAARGVGKSQPPRPAIVPAPALSKVTEQLKGSVAVTPPRPAPSRWQDIGYYEEVGENRARIRVSGVQKVESQKGKTFWRVDCGQGREPLTLWDEEVANHLMGIDPAAIVDVQISHSADGRYINLRKIISVEDIPF